MVSLWFTSKDQRLAIQILLSAPISIWIVSLYIASGHTISRLFNHKSNSINENLLLKTGLGFGLIGNIIMILNFLNLASHSGILLFLGILSVICFPPWIIYLLDKKTHTILPNLKSIKSFPFYVTLILLSIYLIRSFLPPSGIDALMYHLSSIQLYLQRNGFFNIFFNPQSNFPMLTEMNFMIGLAVGNDLICRQIDFLLGVMACGTLVLNCKLCHLTNKEMFTGCSIFLTMTVVIASMSSCNVDLALAVWIGLSVYFTRKAFEKNSKSDLLISAIFAGMAMETKIFGIFVLPLLISATLLLKNVNLKKVAFLILVPIIMAAPWYMKSFFNTGTILSINKTLILDQGLGMPMGLKIQDPILGAIVNSVVRIILSPWSFSIMPSQHQQDCLGPFFIAMIPFAFITRLSSEGKYLLINTGIYMILILFMEMFFIPGGSSIRYTLIVPLFLIPVCLYILKNIRKLFPNLHTILLILITIQIIFGTVLLIKRYHKDWTALICNMSRDCYYKSILPQYPAIKYLNELQGNDTIMVIYNYDNYLIRRPYICPTMNYSEKESLVSDISKYRISYIFANDVFDTLSNSKAFPQLKNKEIVFSQNGFYVYKVLKEDYITSRGAVKGDCSKN